MARVLGVYEKGEAMTDTTSGRSYRIVLAAGAFVAFAISHPASAQDADRAPVASDGREVVAKAGPGAADVRLNAGRETTVEGVIIPAALAVPTTTAGAAPGADAT